MTFGIATLPIVGAVGAAIDFSHANDVKSAMQAALDSTALMLSKDAAKLSQTELTTKADSYFKALFTPTDIKNIIVTAKYDSSASTVLVNGSADVPTSIMGIAGFDTMTVKGSSTAKWGMSRLRIALALDNTLSMAQSNKMTALKSATKDLITKLKTATAKDGDVYVSIIPFNTDVNVNGTGTLKSDWISTAYFGTCSDSKYDNESDCETKGKSDNDNGGGYGGGGYGGYGYGGGGYGYGGGGYGGGGGGYGGGGSNGATWTPFKNWNGCVMDREKSPTAYNVANTAPSKSIADSLFPAHQTNDCPVALLTQTYDWAALKKKIDDMQPVGSTNTTIGLVHAWQTLTDGAPYSPPPIKNDGVSTQKIIIFLTDGENTRDRWSSKSNDIDDRMKAACANAKADNIVIFTVLVMEGNDDLLKKCASPDNMDPKGPKYFKLTSSSQLAAAFDQIGTSLTKLRVAK